MNAVIVAKTRMKKNICVGAVGADSGDLLRLIPRDGAAYHSWPGFEPEIGDLVTITGSAARAVEAPHVEDFIVDTCIPTGKHEKHLASWIRNRCPIWKGNRSCLFDGHMSFTDWGKGHIDRGNPIPSHSVGFWELPAALKLQPGEKKIYSLTALPSLNAPYVGLTEPPEQIPKGTLVRVSLARWWAPNDGGMPEACWLQISGFYSQ